MSFYGPLRLLCRKAGGKTVEGLACRIPLVFASYIQRNSTASFGGRSAAEAGNNEADGWDTGSAAWDIHSLYWLKRLGRDNTPSWPIAIQDAARQALANALRPKVCVLTPAT